MISTTVLTTIYTNGYPRSGQTWLGRLLSDALSSPWQENVDDPIHFWGDDQGGNYVIRKRHTVRDLPFPCAVIFRDPRDVCVSKYFYRGYSSIEHAIHLMVNGKGDEVDNYGPYEEFVRELWSQRNNVKVKYEALHSAPVKTLREVVFLLTLKNLPVDTLQRALKNQTPVAHLARHPEDAHSVRRGIVGDWVNHFSVDDAKLFEKHFGRLMVDQGYTAGPGWWRGLER